jgi:hypothetical protein
LEDEQVLEHARGGEWLPGDHPVARSAADAAGWLGCYEELLSFTTWLIAEARSLASELSTEALAMIEQDLLPLEQEVSHLEAHCRYWQAKVEELNGELNGELDAGLTS